MKEPCMPGNQPIAVTRQLRRVRSCPMDGSSSSARGNESTTLAPILRMPSGSTGTRRAMMPSC